MPGIIAKLENRFQTLLENAMDISWKDPNSPEYDRQKAEDALFHTIGPLTPSPRWVEGKWTSPGEPVPGFQPGGPAPRWSEEEVVMAYAGDPSMIFAAGDNPRSPMYGNKGGAPLLRTAKKVARYYNRANDRQFISDLYSNGFVPLMRMMQPGYDASLSPFISFATRNIQSAMEHGTGGTSQTIAATSKESGIKALLKTTDPNEARNLANQIGGKYQEQSLHDKHPDNPFGKFSPKFYQLANNLATALETGDESRIEPIQNQIRQLESEVDEASTQLLGASTGIGQAISTPDRKTSIGISSIDAPTGDNEASNAGNLEGDDGDDAAYDPETIKYILDTALNYDIGDLVGNIPRYAQMAADMKAKQGKIGGKMTVNELRYVIRTLGPLGSNYPGKDTVRANPQIPRDSKGWWEPGSDPEIEPIPSGGQWNSGWKRNGYKSMGPTEISQEMTTEVKEFEKLGIETARTIKVKKDKRSGRDLEEAVSKVAVANTVKAATVKLRIIAHIHTQETVGESKQKQHPLLEAVIKLDKIDRHMVIETCNHMIRKINLVLESKPDDANPEVHNYISSIDDQLDQLFQEESPEGWKGTINAMLDKHSDEFSKDACGKDYDGDKKCPYAIANAAKKKGHEPHYKDQDGSPVKKESKMQPVDALVTDLA